MPKSLVIVESPTKAKTIGKFLGKNFEVKASYGHVRDLPNSAAEIPASVKKEKWSRLGINIVEDFEPLYVIPAEKQKHVKELKSSLKQASEVLLATDEDREGESISWHLTEVLKPKVPVKRLVFHEITAEAIDESLRSPRQVDQNLVKAQETRRIVDRLFGYSVSPLLWKKMAPRLSAGRVQSVALRLLVERERERIKFKTACYWGLDAIFNKKGAPEKSGQFDAQLSHLGEKRVANGKDFLPATGALDPKADVVHLLKEDAARIRENLLKETPVVGSIEEKPYTTRPWAPFTTSTLQQEASRKLGFAARYTMSVAQKLYENGLITYMRTDSTVLSQEALQASRTLITREFGVEYLHPEPRVYQTTVRNAQEAHEAIRPAGSNFAPPPSVRERFGEDAFRLYELIWKRTLASQMKDACGTRVNIDIKWAEANFKASGKTIEFAGYLRAYVEGSDDPEAEIADREKVLPKLKVGEKLEVLSIEASEHLTQPPPRYTEGSLIKELEKRGIGRPSTWATIVELVLSRTYAFKRGNTLIPTFLAMALTALMEKYFSNLMDYQFTAHLEDDLDSIARGEAQNLDYLKAFYFGNGYAGLKNLIEQGEQNIDPREACGIPIGNTADGKTIEVRIGRYGPFLSDGENRASLPENLAPDEVSVERAAQIVTDAARGPDKLGEHPVSSQPVYLKKGRFGPYIQLGEQTEGGDKPKMVSLLPGMNPDEVTFETALKLLELPKLLGVNPETKEEVLVATGRFGPYVKCGAETRSIPANGFSPLDLDLSQALELLKQPRRSGRTSQPKTLKDLGPHPETKATIALKTGRYGPYVTDGETNAALPKDGDPAALTLAEAVSLLERRKAAGPVKKKGRAKKKR